VEGDIPKFALSYKRQVDKAKRVKVKFGRERNGSKDIWRETELLLLLLLLLLFFTFAEENTNRIRGVVTHKKVSHQQHNFTVECECSTDSRKM
jgi:hypothetical protein